MIEVFVPMSEAEAFKLEHLRTNAKTVREIPKTPVSILLTSGMALVLSLAISSINMNTLLPWYNDRHFHRTIMIAVSLMLSVFWKSLERTASYRPANMFALIVIIHLLFSMSFIYPKIGIKIEKGFLFLIPKVKIHVSAVFYLLNTLVFALYFTFLSFFVKTIPSYTQSRGLFSFLKLRAPTIVYEAKSVLGWSMRLSLGFFSVYFLVFHKVLSFTLKIARISLYCGSFVDIVIAVVTICLNNTVLCIAITFLEQVLVFDRSFNRCGIDLLGDMTLKAFLDVVIAYRENGMKFKTHAKEARIVEKSVIENLAALKQVVEQIEASKKNLDSKIFVTVPQANKKFTKKYRAYHLMNLFLWKLQFKIECFVWMQRFSLIQQNLLEKLNFVLFVKKQEGVLLAQQRMLNDITSFTETTKYVDGKFNTSFPVEGLLDLVNKIQE